MAINSDSATSAKCGRCSACDVDVDGDEDAGVDADVDGGVDKGAGVGVAPWPPGARVEVLQ